MAEFWEMVHVQISSQLDLHHWVTATGGLRNLCLKKCQTKIVGFFSSPHFLDPPHPFKNETNPAKCSLIWSNNRKR